MTANGHNRVLLVGATGFLGRAIAERLILRGTSLRVLKRRAPARNPLPPEVESVDGDLKDAKSLERACAGVTTVISTATSTMSREPGDSIESVDLNGQLALVSAAERAGVRHFVFVSFSPQATSFPLQEAKLRVEDALRSSKMKHTIIQPSLFMEIWLGPALGFDYSSRQVRLYGEGDAPTAWISASDVAHAAAACVDNPRTFDKTYSLGGPEALAPSEVVRIFESTTGAPFLVQKVPVPALQQEYANAQDPGQKSFFGLTLAYARGFKLGEVDGGALLPVPATTVRTYARSVTGSNPTKQGEE